ncbi:MAG: hypothetical protein LBK99_14255 [Opitutaceae bacterium]|nr:hypothetical protein [Opitutaceae bacterium]
MANEPYQYFWSTSGRRVEPLPAWQIEKWANEGMNMDKLKITRSDNMPGWGPASSFGFGKPKPQPAAPGPNASPEALAALAPDEPALFVNGQRREIPGGDGSPVALVNGQPYSPPAGSREAVPDLLREVGVAPSMRGLPPPMMRNPGIDVNSYAGSRYGGATAAAQIDVNGYSGSMWADGGPGDALLPSRMGPAVMDGPNRRTKLAARKQAWGMPLSAKEARALSLRMDLEGGASGVGDGRGNVTGVSARNGGSIYDIMDNAIAMAGRRGQGRVDAAEADFARRADVGRQRLRALDGLIPGRSYGGGAVGRASDAQVLGEIDALGPMLEEGRRKQEGDALMGAFGSGGSGDASGLDDLMRRYVGAGGRDKGVMSLLAQVSAGQAGGQAAAANDRGMAAALDALIKGGDPRAVMGAFGQAGGRDWKSLDDLIRMGQPPTPDFRPESMTLPDGTPMVRTSPNSWIPAPARVAGEGSDGYETVDIPGVGQVVRDRATGKPVDSGKIIRPDGGAGKRTEGDVAFDTNVAVAKKGLEQLRKSIKRSGTWESRLGNSRDAATLEQQAYQLAIQYAKIVDPGSVAREGEVAAAKKYMIPLGVFASREQALAAIDNMMGYQDTNTGEWVQGTLDQYVAERAKAHGKGGEQQAGDAVISKSSSPEMFTDTDGKQYPIRTLQDGREGVMKGGRFYPLLSQDEGGATEGDAVASESSSPEMFTDMDGKQYPIRTLEDGQVGVMMGGRFYPILSRNKGGATQ